MDEKNRIKEYLSELAERLSKGLIKPSEVYDLQEKHQLEPGDIRRIEELAYRHHDRALAEMRQGRTESALAEMERSVTLQPTKADLRIALARLYLERFHNRGYLKRDADRAQKTAESVFYYFPNHREAESLIREIQKARNILKSPRSKIRILPIVLFILLIFAALLYSQRNFIFQRFFTTDSGSETNPAIENPETSILMPSDVSVNTETLPQTDFLTLVHNAEFLIQNNAYAFRINGKIESVSKDIETLEFVFVWDEVNYEPIPVIGPGDPVLAPGETYPFSKMFYLQERPVDPSSANLRLSNYKGVSPQDMEQVSLLQAEGGQILPDGLELAFQYRPIEYTEGFDRNYYTIDYIAENIGYKQITNLDLGFIWKEEDYSEREVLHRVSFLSISDPPLEIGERRARRLFLTTPLAPANRTQDIRIVILEAE